MTRIVTTTYRYKPPPKRKGRKLAEITGPAVVTAASKREHRPPAGKKQPGPAAKSASLADLPAPPANDDRKSALLPTAEKKAAIVTVRDRKLERWERMTSDRRPESDDDPRALDAWRALLANKLNKGDS